MMSKTEVDRLPRERKKLFLVTTIPHVPIGDICDRGEISQRLDPTNTIAQGAISSVYQNPCTL